MFSRLYGAIIETRNFLFEKNIFRSVSLGVPVISVGNITVGGTGKTPLVALITEILAEKGERICILSRGYGRPNPRKRILVSDGENILADAFEAGDEPFELAVQLLGKALVVSDPNRVAAGRWARAKFGVTAFVLDDAFQHRKVKRDLNIITIDATNPFGNGKTLPSGILREPLKNLRRAEAIVITRANLVDENRITELKRQISTIHDKCAIFVAENKIARLIEVNDFQAPTSYSRRLTIDYKKLKAENCLAFCALGNPDNFFEQLGAEKFALAAKKIFSDHYFYNQTDISKLESEAQERKIKFLLTTAKDAVKLKELKFTMPCYIVESAMIFDNRTGFADLILSVLRNEIESF